MWKLIETDIQKKPTIMREPIQIYLFYINLTFILWNKNFSRTYIFYFEHDHTENKWLTNSTPIHFNRVSLNSKEKVFIKKWKFWKFSNFNFQWSLKKDHFLAYTLSFFLSPLKNVILKWRCILALKSLVGMSIWNSIWGVLLWHGIPAKINNIYAHHL